MNWTSGGTYEVQDLCDEVMVCGLAMAFCDRKQS
ncbi:hypothetical protein SLEP1_g43388 [Rubroshorea leprosula]|uniref:Uncharacterized protein n=1 Tax=Rubroshorea leprosula TaxID=152421 RepID=A0AAV5LCT1_9ROSI|nr:hypothetical protein SLEP1_g43388 [Rubroshorea leprosula]